MPAFGRSHKSIHVVWRQKALVSCTTALEKALFCNDRRIDAQSKQPKTPKEKLSSEERKVCMAAGHAAKKAENEKYAALVAAAGRAWTRS